MPKKTILLTAGIFAVAIIGSGVYVRMFKPYEKNLEATTSEGNLSGGSFGSYVANLGNDRNLVGISHNVFVGKVIERTKYEAEGAFTQHWYAVNVMYNIKGNLRGTVVVHLAPGGRGLQSGLTYLIAAQYDSKGGWYTISAPEYDRKLISEDPNLTNDQLNILAEQDKRVQALQAAYPSEIIFAGHIKYNTVYNSYASRRFDANGEVIDDTVELRKQLEAAAASPIESPAESVPPSPTPEASPSEEGTPLAS